MDLFSDTSSVWPWFLTAPRAPIHLTGAVQTLAMRLLIEQRLFTPHPHFAPNPKPNISQNDLAYTPFRWGDSSHSHFPGLLVKRILRSGLGWRLEEVC
jgi:hypothetical protein